MLVAVAVAGCPYPSSSFQAEEEEEGEEEEPIDLTSSSFLEVDPFLVEGVEVGMLLLLVVVVAAADGVVQIHAVDVVYYMEQYCYYYNLLVEAEVEAEGAEDQTYLSTPKPYYRVGGIRYSKG